jgi:hypothetical protein
MLAVDGLGRLVHGEDGSGGRRMESSVKVTLSKFAVLASGKEAFFNVS